MQAFCALREMRRLGNVRSQMKPRCWNVVTYDIDGSMLHRWFLKTLINLSYGGNYTIGRTSSTNGISSEHLVRVAYGLSSVNGELDCTGLSVWA